MADSDKNERNIERLKRAVSELSDSVDRNADGIDALRSEMKGMFAEFDESIQYLIDSSRHSYKTLADEIDGIKKLLE